ncbi:copia-type polyprotein [Trifolium pratense]|uniref:Copia-type polyprotein n=1 Tax=Trifolium pratense TaxID=57577 RepID=A0A2K3MVW3_TRIPR|nr:copia-type polyprotein [Trifolium pratense]PNX94917.1 copia-type polyprotein [Trifolium pratense]PNX96471.1 copia-type polyprotein [Trifolium pratense]
MSHQRLENVTPEEAWSGVKPYVKHLRVFGSLCFRHIPDQMRKKLDDKAQPVVMVGKDVRFYEASSWNWEDNSSSQGKIVYFNDIEPSVPEIQQ